MSRHNKNKSARSSTLFNLFAEPGIRNQRHDVIRKSIHAITYHKMYKKTEIIQCPMLNKMEDKLASYLSVMNNSQQYFILNLRFPNNKNFLETERSQELTE